MDTSNVGCDLIKSFESLRLTAYQDQVGVWTIGWGSTRNVKKGDTITRDGAEVRFMTDLRDAEAVVERFVPDNILTQLPQGAFDALVSFTFNVGPQGFVNKDGSITGLRRAIKALRFDDVPNEMRRWNRAGGQVVAGLTRRREAEAQMWSRSFVS